MSRRGDVWEKGELEATIEHMRNYVYMTHGMSHFCQFNVSYPKSTKKKRWLAALKLGFDKYDLLKYTHMGKVWGDPSNSDLLVIHDLMSLPTFN